MPRTVLIVDDERDTNDILASLVQARGFVPIPVYTGAQGSVGRGRTAARISFCSTSCSRTSMVSNLCDQAQAESRKPI